ncbi:MAG: ABC transporter ATP-binding protein [Robiginitalea sp.]
MKSTENACDSPLSTTGLGIGYRDGGGETQLSGQISFQISPGSLNAVVGVNGVGKSTLLRTLAGMQPSLKGRVLIQGTPIEKLSPVRKAQLLSVVLTEPLASKNLQVSELVSLGRHPYTNWLGQLSEADLQKVREALAKMELGEISGQPCHTLSDGQLQRALIARALAQDTPLMLLDEPTTHLDLYHKVKILKLLREVAHSTRKSILFSTHEIGLAIQLCDHILVLQPGQAHFGSPCELIEAGDFERLFPQDTIHFDAQSGMFRVNK